MRLRFASSACAVLLLLSASPAWAIFVDFTQVSRGPSDTLHVKGVTITGVDGAEVSTVKGVGLGVGADASFDAVMSWDGDPSHFDLSGDWQRVNLVVDGFINSITFQSYMIVEGPAPDPDNPLSVLATFNPVSDFGDMPTDFGINGVRVLDYTDWPLEMRPYEMNDLRLGAYRIDYFTWFRHYWEVNPDFTLRFGFSITSLDYTPFQVPEPSTWSLLALGSVWLLKRRPQTT
jgi:hypothetical protein